MGRGLHIKHLKTITLSLSLPKSLKIYSNNYRFHRIYFGIFSLPLYYVMFAMVNAVI